MDEGEEGRESRKRLLLLNSNFSQKETWMWQFAVFRKAMIVSQRKDHICRGMVFPCVASPLQPNPAICSLDSFCLLFDQPDDFSYVGEPLSFDILLRENKLAVARYVENSSTAFNQFDSRIRKTCLHFRFHPGSLRQEVSTGTVFNENVHNASFANTPYWSACHVANVMSAGILKTTLL